MAALSINALQRQLSLLSAPHPKLLFVISLILGDTWPDPTRVSRQVGERTWEWGCSLHGLHFNMTEMHHWWLLFWAAATWLDIICTKNTSWLQSSGICDETNAQKLCCWRSNIWPDWFTSHQSHYSLLLQWHSRVCIGNSMICSGIWHKYHKWYFEIVICNFTSR